MGKPIPSHKKVTTVILEIDKQRDHPKMFFCYNCRIPVVQYDGHVIHIIPGQHPYEPRTIQKCKGSSKNEDDVWEECNTYYSFLSTIHSKRKVY